MRIKVNGYNLAHKLPYDGRATKNHDTFLGGSLLFWAGFRYMYGVVLRGGRALVTDAALRAVCGISPLRSAKIYLRRIILLGSERKLYLRRFVKPTATLSRQPSLRIGRSMLRPLNRRPGWLRNHPGSFIRPALPCLRRLSAGAAFGIAA
eukprot:4351966-Prymnesium_polylepis.1